MKLLGNLLAAGAILTASAFNSFAQGTVGPTTTTTPISSQLTDWTGSLAFPQFNPAMGILTEVELNFSSTLMTSLSVTNSSPSSTSSGSVKTEMTISVEDGGNNFAADDPQLDILSAAYAYNLPPNTGQGPSGVLTKNGNSGNLIYTASTVLTEFTGVGSINLAASTFTLTDLSNTGGNTSASQTSSASLTGTVTYLFAIPEPSTFGLLAVGLGALPFFRRSRV